MSKTSRRPVFSLSDILNRDGTQEAAREARRVRAQLPDPDRAGLQQPADLHALLTGLLERVGRLEEAVARTPRLDDGPVPPRGFVLGRIPLTNLPPHQYRLLKFVWRARGHKGGWVPIKDAARYVYRDPALRDSDPVDGVKKRLARRLLEAGGVADLVQKTGHYRLELLRRP